MSDITGKWTERQIENFLRQETTFSDEKCKKLAKALSNNGLLNLLIRVNNEEYEERSE